MQLGSVRQQPNEVLSYTVDYTEALTPGETIVSVEGFATPDELEVFNVVPLDGTAAKLWVTGGTHRARYKVTVRATSSGGRVFEDELMFLIVEV